MAIIKQIKYRGKSQSIRMWSTELGISRYNIYKRLDICWPPELVLSKKKFHFCDNLRAAKRVEQLEGYSCLAKHLNRKEGTCCNNNSICQYAVPLTSWEEIKDDPSEGNYYCKLLDEFIVGKYPNC